MTTTAPPIADAAILRQVVLDAAQGETNPYHVARKVLADMTTMEELRTIAEVCFPHWVREQLKRPHAPRLTDAPVAADEDHVEAEPEVAIPPQSTKAAPIMTESPRTFTGSDGVKRASWRRNQFIAYTNALNALVKVDDTHDGKRLRDCTVADLKWMVDYRRKVADQANAAADKFEQLLGAMDQRGVETVGELDQAIGAAILLD